VTAMILGGASAGTGGQYREACETMADATGTVPATPESSAKKGSKPPLPEAKSIREIETLIGNQSIRRTWISEAVRKCGARPVFALASARVEQRSTRTQRSCGTRNCPAPAEAPPVIMAVTKRPSKAYWGLCTCSALYYHCEQCESGFCPRDRLWGWESFSLTPGVLRMTASAAALLSFERKQRLLHELAGAEVQCQAGRTSRQKHWGPRSPSMNTSK